MSKFLKQLGKKELLAPHVDRWFQRQKPEIDPVNLPIQIVKPDDSYFHPSSHVVGCARSIFRLFDPHFKDENDKRMFNPKVGMNGHLWHALLEHVIVDELGFADAYEVPLWYVRGTEGGVVLKSDPGARRWKFSWIAKGTLDIPYVTPPGSGEQYVVDIKTMNPESFIAATPPPYLWSKYVAQMQLYLDWTGTEKGILFCVKAANPFDFKEIIIERDPAHADYIYRKWDVIAEAVRLGTIPPHTCVDPSSCSSLEFYHDDTEEDTRS